MIEQTHRKAELLQDLGFHTKQRLKLQCFFLSNFALQITDFISERLEIGHTNQTTRNQQAETKALFGDFFRNWRIKVDPSLFESTLRRSDNTRCFPKIDRTKDPE